MKLAQPMQAKPERTPNTQRINACEGKWHLNIHGLKWAGIKSRLTLNITGWGMAQSEAARRFPVRVHAVVGRLVQLNVFVTVNLIAVEVAS